MNKEERGILSDLLDDHILHLHYFSKTHHDLANKLKGPMKIPQIENLTSPHGNPMPNQFKIITDDGVYFQSYSTIIAFKPNTPGERIMLDAEKWDYSRTTGKYLNQFLREFKKDTQRKIDDGTYELGDLNK